MIEPPQLTDGRVLAEAMTMATIKFTPIEARTLEASCESSNVVWHQYLRVTQFGGTVYFEEGNGYSVPKK